MLTGKSCKSISRILTADELRMLEQDSHNNKLAYNLKELILQEDAEQTEEKAVREKAFVDQDRKRQYEAERYQQWYQVVEPLCERECSVTRYSYDTTCFQGCLNAHH